MTAPMITKASTALMKSPYRNLLLLIVKVRFEKSGLPNKAATRGVTRSLTNAVITAPNATAMTTATASSTTLPLSRNALKPFISELLSLSTVRNRQHDLPELLRRVEPFQCGSYVGQRIDAVNYWTQSAIDRFEHRLELVRVTHCRAEEARVAKEEPRHRDLRLDSRRRAAGHDPSAHRERAHGLIERGGADVLEHDVDTIAGRLSHRLAEIRRIEHRLGAEPERVLPLRL